MSRDLEKKPLFSKPTNPWYFTLVFLLLGFSFIKATEAFIGMRLPPQGYIIDQLHIWSAPINHFFHEHPITSNTLLITTTLWIDASILFLCIRALFGHTIRPFLELFLFVVFRQTFQFLVSLPIPQGIIWEYPGFPSLMVDYSLQHDLYFSGHVGVAFLITAELMRIGKKWLIFTSLLFFAITIVMLICFRIHYTMDIFTGFLVALLVVNISKPTSSFVDRIMQRNGQRLEN